MYKVKSIAKLKKKDTTNMKTKTKKINRFFDNRILNLCIFFLFVIFTVNGQNTCMPSASNDGIFVGKNKSISGTSSLTTGMIKPGINSYSVASGVA